MHSLHGAITENYQQHGAITENYQHARLKH